MGCKLTVRQREVLILMGKGLGNSDIAKNLFVTLHTVKAHIEAIYEILEVNCRVQAVVVALKKGIISLDDL